MAGTQDNVRSSKKVAASAAAFFAVRTPGTTGAILLFLLLALAGAGPAAAQQVGGPSGLVQVDSVAVEGNARVPRDEILRLVPFRAGDEVGIRQIRTATKELMATGQFNDVSVHALGGPGEPVLLVIRVDERPLMRQVRILGLEHGDPGEVQDSTGLTAGAPFSPAALARARTLIQEQLADEGIPFASVEDRLLPVEGMQNVVDLVLDVTEGNRVTVAQVVVSGNEEVSTDAIVGAMTTRPEGFWWFRTGQYEEGAYQEDLNTNIPELYASRGYLNFQILSDTLVIDPSTGKARVELEVREGPQFRIAQFQIEGNTEIGDDEMERFFLPEEGGLLRSLGIGGRDAREAEQRGRVFDRVAFDEAIQEVTLAYANRGYIWAQVNPAIEELPVEEGEDPTVSVTVQIQEGNPAYIDQIAIRGNDYTHDWVIRDKIFVLPGDVYNQERVIQSYQSIQSLGFFQAPLPPPNIEQRPETGEVDITFEVVEKQTGAVNFGTSVGGGVGLAGFVGYDQPNLFGQAKEGHLRWDFGRYLNNFTLSFSDPALFRSRISGSLSLFNSRDRFFQFNTGQRRRIGASVRLGFPVPGAPRSRFFAGYSISRTKYQLFQGVDDASLFGRDPGTQSQVSLGIMRNRLNHPVFPTVGSRQNVNLELNGGLLGGDGEFQKLTADAQWWVPVAQVGDPIRPIRFALGLKINGGAVFGDAENFPFDRFWMGGVQFGQQLRGYDETSITPLGFFPERSRAIRDINRLGDAFLSISAEYAMRLNDNISLSTFFDAGNVWADPGDVDPSRLFRGAGFGLQLVTPFGPVGIDYAYGFDKPTPGWQLHFRMGPGF